MIIVGFLLGTPVLLFGAQVGSMSATRTIDHLYNVDVRTDPSLAWTLWTPKASVDMAVTTQGSVRSIVPVTTSFGPMENVTGVGSVRVQWTLHRTFDRSVPMDSDARFSVTLSAQEDNTSHVWRMSANLNATIELSLGIHVAGSQVGESFECGGPNYSGKPSEGWDILRMGFGDCHVDYYLPWSDVILPGLVVGGAGVIGASAIALLPPKARP
ncbi:MAG: hypothetical protein E6K17_07230 [Methanobacteriota archaeon]|nr:MAG: hypothetical protein E6K17_07230 [Euryarchaeota archaeon]